MLNGNRKDLADGKGGEMKKAGRFIQGFLFTLIGCLFLAAFVWCVYELMGWVYELIKASVIEMIKAWGGFGILFVITVLAISIVGGVWIVKQEM